VAEQSRKRGPFDGRYPPIRHKPAPAKLWRPGDERLDWQGFLARFAPDSTRHDFDALAAYESYRTDIDSRPAVAPAPAPGNASHPPATPDIERWEGDGGRPTSRVGGHVSLTRGTHG
jgi:hypothetical protein